MKLSSCKLTQRTLTDELYVGFEDSSLSREDFINLCIKMVMSSRVPNQQIIRQLKTMSREKALMTTNNFILKGHGFGVVK